MLMWGWCCEGCVSPHLHTIHVYSGAAAARGVHLRSDARGGPAHVQGPAPGDRGAGLPVRIHACIHVVYIDICTCPILLFIIILNADTYTHIYIPTHKNNDTHKQRGAAPRAGASDGARACPPPPGLPAGKIMRNIYTTPPTHEPKTKMYT